MKTSFTKWQGTGNDFILIDTLKEGMADYQSMAKKLCDRHYGIGADGILLVLPSEKADIRMQIINADGSEAEMCGNGIRCFAKYVREAGHIQKDEFTVETGAGILVPSLIREEGEICQVRVDMGRPILAGEDIPVAGFGQEKVIKEAIEVDGEEFLMTCVSMGNPHCVVFVEEAESFPIYRFGPKFECHEKFPKKINTEFVEVLDRKHLRMRVWERGAAVTLACGTGSCAALTAAVLNDLADREAEIILDGGRLQVTWAENDHLYMTGPATRVFAGEFSLEDL